MSTDIAIVPRSEVGDRKIEDFLDRLDDALLYYRTKYCDFLGALLECEVRYDVAVAGGEIQGVFPLLYKDGPLGKVINSSPFFGSHGGVLAVTWAAERALWERYRETIGGAGVAAATVICHPWRDPPVSWVGRVDHEDIRISQFTVLDFQDEESLMAKITGPARRNIRKAEKEGIQVTKESQALLDLMGLHVENMRNIGGTPKPDRFFSLLPEYFSAGQDYDVYVARRRGKVISALLVFFSGKVVEYFIPGTALEARRYQPSAAILRSAMLDAVDRGFRIWNWGGTWTSQTGVLAFKRKWGAVDRRYCYFTVVNDDRFYEKEPHWLQDVYPFFYLLPFGVLHGGGGYG